MEETLNNHLKYIGLNLNDRKYISSIYVKITEAEKTQKEFYSYTLFHKMFNIYPSKQYNMFIEASKDIDKIDCNNDLFNNMKKIIPIKVRNFNKLIKELKD
jgi:hypothetical protein